MNNRRAMVYGKRLNGKNCLVHSVSGNVDTLVAVAERASLYKAFRSIGLSTQGALNGTALICGLSKIAERLGEPVGK